MVTQGESMNIGKRRLSIILFSTAFMILSLLFQNCSSRLSSQSASLQPTDSARLDFSGVNDFIKVTEMPNEFTNQSNGVIRYEVAPALLDATDYVEFQIDAQDWQIAYDNQIVLTGVAYGQHAIKFRAISKNGSASEISAFSWFVDNVKPALSLDPIPPSTIQQSTAQIAFTLIEQNIQTVVCTINEEIIPNCQSPISLQNLSNLTAYEVKIKIKDRAGNTTEQSVAFSVAYLAPTFAVLKAMIFSRRCAGCHNSQTLAGGLNLTTFPGVLSVVTPGNVSTSKMYNRLTTLSPGAARMPLSGPFLTDVELQAISEWITAGAQNN